MLKRIALIAIALSLASSGIAQAKQYVLKHPKREHCKAHYVRKVEHVKKREHGRLVKVKETVCVYAAPKPSVKVAPTPPLAALPPARALHLKAHLDPSFTRDPSDPFKVTYAYSASATVETAALATAAITESTPLPEGVLSLYNDGLLACSINVGGSATGGECPVAYSKLGEHTVTTIYSSGATSATETSVENIETLKGNITLNVAYVPLAHSTREEGESGCSWEEWAHGGSGGSTIGCKRWVLGYIEVHGTLNDEAGASLGVPWLTINAPSCSWTANSYGCGNGGSNTEFTVWATTTKAEWCEESVCEEHGERIAEVGLLSGIEKLPTTTQGGRCNNTGCIWDEVQQGHLSIASLEGSDYSAMSGYNAAGYSVAEAKAPISFIPEIR